MVGESRSYTDDRTGQHHARGKALNEQGIDYEVVKGPTRPGKRVDLQRLTGQNLYPVIEFEDGSFYREESKDMAATIRAGKLDEKRSLAS